MKTIYVTYTYQSESNSVGHGRMFVDYPTDIRNSDDIHKAEQLIREKNPSFKAVFLTFWKELDN